MAGQQTAAERLEWLRAQLELAQRQAVPGNARLPPVRAQLIPRVSSVEDKQLPILLVDDDESALLLVRRVLERDGYSQVESTSDPLQVPAILRRSHPRLVLLDLHMPQVDGLDLIAQLDGRSDEASDVPCLVLTADESGEARHRALRVGARDFLTKPFDQAELLLRVRNLLRVQQVHDGLVEQNAHLERRREDLQRDVDSMQAALVPELPASMGGLAISVAYRPADGPGAGGDFYDVFPSTAGRVAIVLGDVSGHGRHALAHAALTRYTLRTYLQAGMQPRMALAAAARQLKDPGSQYATVAVALYDGAAQTLTYALAGHPHPLLSDAHGVIHTPVTACSSPPIGWSAPTGLRQTQIGFAPGSQACFFSDGLIEARRGPNLLGREGLEAILASLGPGARADELLSAVGKRADRLTDDMVACVVSPQPATKIEHPAQDLLRDAAPGRLRARVPARSLAARISPRRASQRARSARRSPAGKVS